MPDLAEHEELLNRCRASGDSDGMLAQYIQLIGLCLKLGSADSAFNAYERMQADGLSDRLPPSLALRMARQMERKDLFDAAAALYERLYADTDAEPASFQAILSHAYLALRTRQKALALSLFRAAARSKFPHYEFQAVIEHGLSQAEALPE
jgi:hypothetical protein